jgi:hypothetical protein
MKTGYDFADQRSAPGGHFVPILSYTNRIDARTKAQVGQDVKRSCGYPTRVSECDEPSSQSLPPALAMAHLW